jgi:threonylcarbamoyladenosine tRNA methylthiotransferase MtaB
MFCAAFYTLGCKLNQLETESVAGAFKKAGWSIVPWNDDKGALGNPDEKPDLLVLNTCTVTSRSEQKARHVIRKALRDNPGAALLVSGCYAQLEADAIEALDAPPSGSARPRLFVVKGSLKDRLLDLPALLEPGIPLGEQIQHWAAQRCGSQNTAGAFRFNPGDFSFHSRASLKIQDGCDNSCAFCRVHIARGKSRSLDAPQVLARLAALEEKGYAEAVLTGVNISQYGGGLPQLARLLEYLLAGTKTIALRLSSIEPDGAGFGRDFIQAVSQPRIRPHFHLSLQAGSERTLSRMGRSYTPAQAMAGIRALRDARDDPFLACDIISGFPGETAEDAEKTYSFCREAGFAWIHAFPFSRRPGTAAWNFKDRVSEREAALRSGRLAELARQGKEEYVRRWIGKTVRLIVETSSSESCVRGISDNYLRVAVPLPLGGRPMPGPGKELQCKLVKAAEKGDAGIPAGSGPCERFDVLGEIYVL